MAGLFTVRMMPCTERLILVLPFSGKEQPVIPPPLVLGLTLCDYLLIEEGTRKISLIGSFRELEVARLPGVAPPFGVYTMLTDGAGDATIEVVIRRLDRDEQIYSASSPFTFDDRLSVVDASFHVNNCSFPVAGWYEVNLQVDEEEVAKRRLLVRIQGGIS